MPQNAKQRKHSNGNDNSQSQILPTDRMDFLTAIAMDGDITAKESMAIRVAAVILKHRHNETGTIVLKRQTIADEIGCSPGAVDKAVAVLKRRPWFNVKHVFAARRTGANTGRAEIIANAYDPCWDQAAAFWGSFSMETRKRVNVDDEGVIRDDEDVRQDDRGITQNGDTPPTERGDLSHKTRRPLPQNAEAKLSVLTQGLKPSDLNSVNPGRSAPGLSPASARIGASADRQGDVKQWPYKQSQGEADQTFARLERMPWKAESDDPAYDPSDRAEKAAGFHWIKLLREGIAAWRIEAAAEKYLKELPAVQHACLAGFLGRYARQCVDPDEWLYIPDRDDEPSAGQPNDDWPRPSRTSVRLAMHYPCYPGPHKPDEIKRVEAELKKLRGKIAFRQILDGVVRYAETRSGEDYRKTMKLSAFLAQRKWEDHGAANDNRQAPARKVSGIDWENDPPF